MTRRRWIVPTCASGLVALAIGVLAWVGVSRRTRVLTGRGPLPLSASPFLADIIEPITIVDVMSFDDGGSLGLRFKDAKGRNRDVRLNRTMDGECRLDFNTLFPSANARRVPISGVEERAFLGLLERWRDQDADVQALERSHDRYNCGEIDNAQFYECLSEEQRFKLLPFTMLRDLRMRN